MIESIVSFYGLVFLLMGGYLLVRVFYYFKFKRDHELSEFDKSVWHLKLTSVFLAVLMYASFLYLPSGFYELIDTKTSAPDVVVGQLVRNQTKMAEDIRQSLNIFYFLISLTAAYLIGVATFIGKSQNERRKAAAKNGSLNKKPLGL